MDEFVNVCSRERETVLYTYYGVESLLQTVYIPFYN